MSDHSTSSGPAGSEHDGHDRSETGTATRVKRTPLRVSARTFVNDGHTVKVTSRRHPSDDHVYVYLDIDGDYTGEICLFIETVQVADRLAEAARLAKVGLQTGEEFAVCVTGHEPESQPVDQPDSTAVEVARAA